MTSLLYISTLLTYCFCFVAGDDACTTPNGVQGTCIGIMSCPYMMNIARHATPATRQFIRNHICLGEDPRSVCCPSTTTSTSITEERNCEATALPPPPHSQCCGIDESRNYKIAIGYMTPAVKEYPWLALLEYNNNEGVVGLLCGGVLISGQHILTAGHCLFTRDGPPVNVRLGEYNTSNSGPDCQPEFSEDVDCTDGAVSIPIEKITIHPNFSNRTLHGDIAVIKLTRIVQFTDFIKPICLPTLDFTMTSPQDVYLHSAGWGRVRYESGSDIKLDARLPYVSKQDCELAYRNIWRQIRMWEDQICAGGDLDHDKCKGDSGGPLMRKLEGRYELVGILAYGPNHCGTPGIPNVYTNVYDYLPWIMSQVIA